VVGARFAEDSPGLQIEPAELNSTRTLPGGFYATRRRPRLRVRYRRFHRPSCELREPRQNVKIDLGGTFLFNRLHARRVVPHHRGSSPTIRKDDEKCHDTREDQNEKRYGQNSFGSHDALRPLLPPSAFAVWFCHSFKGSDGPA
jgi:hypothetical protein